jgi:hypothetical protein
MHLQATARVSPADLVKHFTLKRSSSSELASDLSFFYHA